MTGAVLKLPSWRRAGQASLWVFAFIGFIAAALQIGEYWIRATSTLQVRLIAHERAEPSFVDQSFGILEMNSPLRRMVRKARQVKCREQVDVGNTEINIGSLDDLTCENASKLESSVSFLGDALGHDKLYQINITNTGTTPAQNIRLLGAGIDNAEILLGTRDRQALQKSSNAFTLPSLNPGETMSVYAWGGFSAELDGGPRVTFAGGRVDFRRLVPEEENVSLYGFMFERLTAAGIAMLALSVLILAALFSFIYLQLIKRRGTGIELKDQHKGE